MGLVGAAAEERHARTRACQLDRERSEIGGGPPFGGMHDDRRLSGGGGEQPECLALERPIEQVAAPLVAVLEARHRLAGGIRERGQRRLKRGGDSCEDRVPPRDLGHGTAAADELDAGASLVALDAEWDHHANLGGSARVRSAAGVLVEALDLDHAHALADVLGGVQPERLGFFPADLTHRHRACLPDHLVRDAAPRPRDPPERPPDRGRSCRS